MKICKLVLAVTMIISCTNPKEKTADQTTELEMVDLFSSTESKGEGCYRIPALVTATDGTVIAAIDDRVSSCDDLRSNQDINIAIRRSKDHGANWGPLETIIDFPPGQSASDPSMIVDEMTNEVFLFYNYMDLDQETGIYYLHLVKSSDYGKTWSEPLDITNQVTNPAWQKDFKFITSGRGTQTKGGKLLHCLVNLEHGVHVIYSDDHGVHWDYIDTPIVPGDESKIIELNDGSWMINTRVKGGTRYVHISKDEGKTWLGKAVSDLADPACNASLIRYPSLAGDQKTRLLFSNANSPTDRINMTVRLSFDEGESWPVQKTIYSGSSAYSSMTILKNGNIGILFERDDYRTNSFVSFSLDWLTE